MFLAAITTIDLVQYAVVALVILAAIYIVLKIGKNILKWVLGIVINSILGFIAIFLLDYIFHLGLPFNLPVVIATALFGLPAVGTLTILKLMGMLVLVG
jgi:hypothetical protein